MLIVVDLLIILLLKPVVRLWCNVINVCFCLSSAISDGQWAEWRRKHGSNRREWHVSQHSQWPVYAQLVAHTLSVSSARSLIAPTSFPLLTTYYTNLLCRCTVYLLQAESFSQFQLILSVHWRQYVHIIWLIFFHHSIWHFSPQEPAMCSWD